MPEHDPFDDIEAFYDAYLKAFAAQDMASLDRMFEYPYILRNDGIERTIENGDFYRSIFASFEGSGYASSRFDSFQKFRMGDDGAMVTVKYTRLRADGSVMKASSGGAYLLRHRPDGWRIIALFDDLG